MTNVLEFQTEQEKVLTLAILDTIVTDLDAFSHPALAEPEIKVRRQILHNVQRIVSTTNYRGEYGRWRERARLSNRIGAFGSLSVFFLLGGFAWVTTGHWWNAVGDFVFGLISLYWFLMANRFLGAQEWLEQLKLPIPKVELPNSKAN